MPAWENYAAIPDKYNHPGKFTSFVGFEWTSAPQAQNLHRCVIFADKGPAMPYTAFESVDPEDLWRYLEGQRKLGLDVIAVPHNGNVSNGLMFDTRDLSGKPLTREYAERRMANEPLAEIMQTKGQSDTDPQLSPNDEFADFEIWKYLLDGSGIAKSATGSYIRQAYGVGQELQAKIGANPFKYGIEGGTDFHSGIDTTEPNNYAGSHGNQDNDPRTVVTATKSVGWRAADGTEFRRADRRLGGREHARIDLCGVQAQGNVWHVGRSDQGANVRQLELRSRNDEESRLGEDRLRPGCADGRRPAGARLARQVRSSWFMR